MARYEYMKISIDIIPEDIIIRYKLKEKVHNGYVYVEIRKGMYGLPQAGKIANDDLQRQLAPHGYRPVKHTPYLWKHDTRATMFKLVVDDFGTKIVSDDDEKHLIETLQKYYKISIDREGKFYLRMILDWDYKKRTLDVSMPGYVQEGRKIFGHQMPKQPVYGPSKFIPITYGQKIQTEKIDTSAPIKPEERKRVEQVCGLFLCYARAVDPTMLHALNVLATQQDKDTKQTVKQIENFLKYCVTCSNAKIRYCASDMKLWIHSDTSYLNEPGAKSRYGGYHFLVSNGDTAINNAPISAISKVLKNVMSSVAEAELGEIFHNAKEGVSERITMEEMGHPQGNTNIISDNTTAIGIANKKVKHKRTKAMAMKFYWVQDREAQGQFKFFWRPGYDNEKADYFTKDHPAKYHRNMRPKIFNKEKDD